eukprot:TRINITY_DN2360_c0_g2_i1.p1 TRINITY_DN2360_c0_g2~~TRINITY_DN2360_c0_g2_i1.p1  ORF type:complete len:481 (-),score=87.82 TRINITY_DN2360_c0_g2_i1:47-1489(-)
MAKVFEIKSLDYYFDKLIPDECFEIFLNYHDLDYLRENFSYFLRGITFSENDDFANTMIERVGIFKFNKSLCVNKYDVLDYYLGPVEYSDKSMDIMHNSIPINNRMIRKNFISHHHFVLKSFPLKNISYETNLNGLNIFQLAVIHDTVELLKRLFEVSLSPYRDDGNGLLVLAVDNYSFKCLEYLIKSKVINIDINKPNRRNGMTALHRACSDNKGKCIQLLLQREDIRLDLFDNRRLLAIQHCHPDFLHLFINPMTTRNFSMESVGESFEKGNFSSRFIFYKCRICKNPTFKFPKRPFKYRNKYCAGRICLFCLGSEYEEAFSHIIKHMPWNHYLPIIYDILFKNNNNIYQLTRDCDINNNNNNDNSNNNNSSSDDGILFHEKNNRQTTQFNKYYNHKSFREFSMDYNEDGYKEENINCQKCSFQSKNIYDFIQNGFYNPNSYKGDKLKLKNKKTICIHCKVIDQRALSFIHKDYSYLT